ncbi:Protein trichome birefringence-like 38, partial [Linum grandiflorum]
HNLTRSSQGSTTSTGCVRIYYIYPDWIDSSWTSNWLSYSHTLPNMVFSSTVPSCVFPLLATCILALVAAADGAGRCSNLYEGSWVPDMTYPSYNSSTCPFVRKEFDCLKYGRLDRRYLQYRWQPSRRCILPRFNGAAFLRRMRGKKIMFIGDSISMNQYNSLLCLLHASIPSTSKITTTNKPVPTVTFQNYGVSVMLFTTHYLVDIQQTKIGPVLNLNAISSGKLWKQMDVLVFNTWLWWPTRGPKQGWKYIQDGKKISKDMDPITAFTKAMNTWAKWVDLTVNTTKTTVFFQGVSPSHYKGADWGKPEVQNCGRETTPIRGPTRAIKPLALKIQEDVIAIIKKPVHFLNITQLSNMRKDGHPSSYNGFGGMD